MPGAAAAQVPQRTGRRCVVVALAVAAARPALTGALVAEACMDIFDLAELEICPWALR